MNNYIYKVKALFALSDYYFRYFIVFSFCSVIVGVYLFYSRNSDIHYCTYLFAEGVFLSYCISRLLQIVNKIPYVRYLQYVVVGVMIGFYFGNIIACVTFREQINEITIPIILGTNISEAGDFISAFSSWNLMTMLGAGGIALVLIWVCVPYIKSKFVKSIAYAFALFGGLAFFHNPAAANDVVYGGIYNIFALSETPNIKDYYKERHIKDNGSGPQNVIVIFGESHSKKHSQLYGWRKSNEPRLSDLKENGQLILFNKVTSAAPSTDQSFKYMMSTYSRSSSESKWYECMSIPEVLTYSTYESYWISNQNKHAVYNNNISSYASLFNHEIWTEESIDGTNNSHYDGDLLPLLRENVKNTDKKKCIFVHLMGSHFVYDKRYPKNFSKWSVNDYLDDPEYKRQALATYDNSILYNDYIVSEIIARFSSEETIVLYFPDHGEDIYDSSADYCGHGKPGDPVSFKCGTDIPFMVYMSDKYKKHYPHKSKVLSRNVNKEFCTEDILYILMDILGLELNDNRDVEKVSIVRE